MGAGLCPWAPEHSLLSGLLEVSSRGVLGRAHCALKSVVTWPVHVCSVSRPDFCPISSTKTIRGLCPPGTLPEAPPPPMAQILSSSPFLCRSAGVALMSSPSLTPAWETEGTVVPLDASCCQDLPDGCVSRCPLEVWTHVPQLPAGGGVGPQWEDRPGRPEGPRWAPCALRGRRARRSRHKPPGSPDSRPVFQRLVI